MEKIDPSKGWYSAQELAGLPGMPTTDRRVRERAEKNSWVVRTKVQGKGAEYALRSLPQVTQDHILGLLINAQPTSPSASEVAITVAKSFAVKLNPTPGQITKGGQTRRAKPVSQLDDKSRAAQEGALILCRKIDEAIVSTGRKATAACGALAERFLNGQAHDELKHALLASQTKPRKAGPTLEGLRRHLQRIYALYLAGCKEGDAAMYLVPGKREKEGHNPLHVAVFLKYWCVPSQPDIAMVWRNGMVPALQAQGLEPPSYSVACRIENSLPVTVKHKGRMTGSAFKALMPYIQRDVSMFKANDFWVGDGHSFKAKIQSPLHGNAFTPEVTAIIDWVSRKIVGWSVALSESTIAVSDAFRHAQLRTRGRPLIYYSDNGSGQTGKHIDHELTGSLARQGIAHHTGIPGNPQGRGIIERWWPTVLLPLASRYPTFVGKKADKETVRKVSSALARAQRADIDSPLLPSFKQFLFDLAEAIETYNATHKHSALGGLTPDQAYEAKLDPDSIGAVTDAEIACLWMPEEIRTPRRGRIELLNNVYWMPELVHLLREGEQVRVRFDIHNAKQVWVLRMSGESIGVALWDRNKKAAFAETYVDQKRIERAEGIKDRAQKEIDRADAELLPTYEFAQAPVLDRELMPVGIDPDLVDDDEKMLPFSETVRLYYAKKTEHEDDHDEDEDEDSEGSEVATR